MALNLAFNSAPVDSCFTQMVGHDEMKGSERKVVNWQNLSTEPCFDTRGEREEERREKKGQKNNY